MEWAGAPPGPHSPSGCVRGQWRRVKSRFRVGVSEVSGGERRADSGRGLGRLVAWPLPSLAQLWQPLLGLAVPSGPTLCTGTLKDQFTFTEGCA